MSGFRKSGLDFAPISSLKIALQHSGESVAFIIALLDATTIKISAILEEPSGETSY